MPYPEQIRWAKFRVVVMTIAALAVISWLVSLMLGGLDYFQPTMQVRTYVPDSAGLMSGTPVRLNGILIGKIRSVALTSSRDPRRVIEITMSLQRRRVSMVPDDSTVALQAENVLGDKFIDISKGRSAKPVQPGGELVAPAPPGVDTANLMRSVRSTLNNVDKALSDVESGTGNLGKLFKGGDYDKIVAATRRYDRRIGEIARRGNTAGRLLYDDVDYRQIQSTLKRVDDTLAGWQAGRGQAGNWLKDTADYDRLRRTVAGLNRSLETVQSNSFLADDKLYRRIAREAGQLTATIDALNAGEGKLGALSVTTQLYESLDGSMRRLQTGVAEFRANPKKYLWLRLR